MAHSVAIGLRYLRAKKRLTVSLITFISILGVAIGVGALLVVLSITSGFQQQFRDKVLGVNADVLVLKYGIDFSQYRRVMKTALELPEVKAADPFLINEMMLAKGDHLRSVLVKGVDPDLVGGVLDLPRQIVEGELDGIRSALPAPAPPAPEEDEGASPLGASEERTAPREGEAATLVLRSIAATFAADFSTGLIERFASVWKPSMSGRIRT